MLAALLLAATMAARPASAAPEETPSLRPILAVATDIPALRVEVARQADQLFRTPLPIVQSGFLEPAAASEQGVDVRDEARRVVAGLAARPDDLSEQLPEVSATFGNEAAKRLHFAAHNLRDQGRFEGILERVRRVVPVDDPFYAERLRNRLKRMFDDGIAESLAAQKAAAETAPADAPSVRDGRQGFHWVSGLSHGEQKESAKVLPFKRPEKKTRR